MSGMALRTGPTTKNNPAAYPGGSRERVSRAGDALRAGRATTQDFEAFEHWRAAHRHVLNSFQSILRSRTRGNDVVVAQRHKRRSTILGKLQRFPGMRLHRMDDVAGCRLIFHNLAALYTFRQKLHQARFRHELRNAEDKYDYIKHPKQDGYRGIHDIYKYDAKSQHGAPFKGLQIELQYRTIYQHAWATCVEVIGLVTKSNPKFKKGDKRYEAIMTLASEMIARVWEGLPGPLPELNDIELSNEFRTLDLELGFMAMLGELESSSAAVGTRNHNIILIFSEDAPLEILTYRDARAAVDALFDLEVQNIFNEKDIVLVRGNRQDVRTAFKNYFSDASDFLLYINEAFNLLSK